MKKNSKFTNTMSTELDITEKAANVVDQAELTVFPYMEEASLIAEFNQLKVLEAMQQAKVSDAHFATATGYGYNDAGREVLETVYANVFRAEAALVRPQMVSGTHALAVALFGNLRPDDTLLYVTGAPYDTLHKVIGIQPADGSLADFGINYQQVDLLPDGTIDYTNLAAKLEKQPIKMAAIQRSKGYAWRRSLTIAEIDEVIRFIKNISPATICMVDNCYGEFVEYTEPVEAGADLAVGSLIKNPGGGLAPVGGYVVGAETYVKAAAARLTAPGLAMEVGPTLGLTSALLQGLFLAPQVVEGSIRGAIIAARAFENLGFAVLPTSTEKRSDIVQAIKLGSERAIMAFCRGIQQAAPVDSFVTPEKAAMPGYAHQVVMAAGAFVQGSSIELSADAPLIPPYIVYMQGGITRYHAKIGVTYAIKSLMQAKIID
ncbi:MAG: methionine gamma-lyase family protein [Defluviitaleaceae bacterium]|nr:methionine gamma-lyase family protein [Defluviitaleaceae bacterium]